MKPHEYDKDEFDDDDYLLDEEDLIDFVLDHSPEIRMNLMETLISENGVPIDLIAENLWMCTKEELMALYSEIIYQITGLPKEDDLLISLHDTINKYLNKNGIVSLINLITRENKHDN